MIIIGICDGEQAVRSLLAGYVERYHADTGVEIRLLSYNTGEKLLQNYILDRAPYAGIHTGTHQHPGSCSVLPAIR